MNKPAMRVEQHRALVTHLKDWQDELTGIDPGTAGDCYHELLDAADELVRIRGEIDTWIKRTLLACDGDEVDSYEF